MTPFAGRTNTTYRGGGLTPLVVSKNGPARPPILGEVNRAFENARKKSSAAITQKLANSLQKKLQRLANVTRQLRNAKSNAEIRELQNRRDVLQARIDDEYNVLKSGNTGGPQHELLRQNALKDVALRLGGEHGIVPQAAFDAFLAHKIPALEEYGVFAHGTMQPFPRLSYFVVPKDTAIVYVTLPGLLSVVGGRQPRNRKHIFEDARRGRAESGKGYLAMYTEGSKIPDTLLNYNDDTRAFGGLTGVWNAKTGAKTHMHGHSVSELVRTSGPGVYYVMSCRYIDSPNMFRNELQEYWTHEARARELQRKYTNPKTFNRVTEPLENLYKATLVEKIFEAAGWGLVSNIAKGAGQASRTMAMSSRVNATQGIRVYRSVPQELMTTLAYLAMAGQMVGLVPQNKMTILKGGSVARFLQLFGTASKLVGGPASMTMSMPHRTALEFLWWAKNAVVVSAYVRKAYTKVSATLGTWSPKRAMVQKLKKVDQFLRSYGLRRGLTRQRIQEWWWKQAWRPNQTTKKAYMTAMAFSS